MKPSFFFSCSHPAIFKILWLIDFCVFSLVSLCSMLTELKRCNFKLWFSVTFKVFACASGSCGHFYHPECVAKLLHPANKNQAEMLQDKIAAGESFTCPAHKCFDCKRGENRRKHEMQFAICRRCPKAYHRKCLPRYFSIQFFHRSNFQEFIFLL